MNAINQIIGALVEAWGEVKVQRARVILSLVGVVAAVAAMTTVIALGDLMVQSNKEQMEAWSGRAVTLRVVPQKTQNDGQTSGGGAGGGVRFMGDGTAVPIEPATEGMAPRAEEETPTSGWSTEATGQVNDPVGSAMLSVAKRFEIPYWSRMEQGNSPIREINELRSTGTYRGQMVTPPEYGYNDPQITAIDPDYSVLFRLTPLTGRWLRSGDVNQRVTPIVINSVMWEYFGKPNIYEPMVISTTDQTPHQMRVVGVIKASSAWDAPTIYMPYDSWQLSKPAAQQGQGMPTMMVWAGPDQVEEARQKLPSALAATLGDGWRADVSGGESFDSGEDLMKTIRDVVMIIGAIVVFLGALGLLNVAIVTVRQRIREIGIRRAMGASATRVFFSVFMESVVATFVAGILGVAIAIVVLRMMPLETMGIMLQERPPFPMSAAIAGVAISTSVGALCGVIPAFGAIRVKPIDAIRY